MSFGKVIFVHSDELPRETCDDDDDDARDEPRGEEELLVTTKKKRRLEIRLPQTFAEQAMSSDVYVEVKG